ACRDDCGPIFYPRHRGCAFPTRDQRQAIARDAVAGGAAAGPHQLIVSTPSRISKLFRRLRKLIPGFAAYVPAYSPDSRTSCIASAVAIERLLGGNWKIRPAAGLYFKREWCAVVDQVPVDLDVVRY